MAIDRLRVLSIDGGGIRGYLPALVLAEMETRSGRPAADLFDLIVGTSTGAIIGAGLSIGMRAGELAEFYPRYGRKIFGGTDNKTALEKRIFGPGANLWESMTQSGRIIGGPFGGNPRFGGNARHTATGLEGSLAEVLGDRLLSQVTTEYAATTFDRISATPVVLSSRDARTDATFDLPLHMVARATSAAPTFFPPLDVTWGGASRQFVDGGVWANNPGGVALSEALALKGDVTPESIVMVSLGTGVAPGDSVLDGNGSWLGVAMDLAGMATSVWAGELLARRALQANLHRFQVLDTDVAGPMNDPSTDRLEALKRAATSLVTSQSAALDRAISELT